MTRGRRQAAASQPAGRDPFAELGLAGAADLTDDDVRAAWRRIAVATHPDRADGGDPRRFAAAAAAYTELRTSSGRGEVRARLAVADGRTGPLSVAAPVRLACRVVATAGGVAVALIVAGPGPAGPSLAAGALTWLVLTGRGDLAATLALLPARAPRRRAGR